MRRYALSDDQFARIEHLLAGRPGHVGRNSDKGNRLFVEAVIWKLRTGVPWRDLPERFGDWKNTHKRFSRWPKAAFARVKGYDSEGFIEHLEVRRIKPVIPPRANRKTPRDCDFALYCERNLVERFFNIIKHFRAIATRYEKTARNFLAGVHLVCALAWLK